MANTKSSELSNRFTLAAASSVGLSPTLLEEPTAAFYDALEDRRAVQKLVKQGERVRFSFGNLSMDSHPIHVHGYRFEEVSTDGGTVPKSARRPETTVNVPVGTTRTVELVANEEGDWAFHCHKSHHTMNAMSHDVPNMLGVSQKAELEAKVRELLPGYMAMGEHGMAEHHQMDEMVDELNSTDFSSPGWLVQFKKLKHKAFHHLEDEEHAIFQLAGKVLTEGQKQKFAKDYEAEFATFRLGEMPLSSAES